MRQFTRTNFLVGAFIVVVVLFLGCSTSKNSNPVLSSNNPNASDIDAFIAGLPDYTLTPPAPRPTTKKSPVYVVRDDAGWLLDYRFDVDDSNIVVTTNEIMSPNQNFGVLWPGNIVQGKSITTGTLKQLLVDRSPMTLTISLDAPVTSVVVDTPNSVTAQQAVSDLERSVDASLIGDHSPSNPGTVNFKVSAANSFDQSMLSMGVTGGYSESMAGQIGASAGMSVTRGFSDQTIVARLVQKLFTIRVADDLPSLRKPSDFFAPGVTVDDLKAEEADGNIGPDNLPMYIESVTYGRIIIFTLRSTSATSVDSLAAAINATYSGYTGGAGANSSQQSMLSTRTTEVYQAGGDAAAAQAAIANLDFSQFFTDMQATEAVPISFKLKELKAGANGDFVNIFDSTSFDERNNGTRPTGYTVTVSLDKIVHTQGLCTGCVISGLANSDNILLPKNFLGTHTFLGTPPETYTFGSKAVVQLSYEEPSRSALIMPFVQTESERSGLDSKYGHRYEYPFNEVARGATHKETLIDNGLTTDFDLYFSISKTPVY